MFLFQFCILLAIRKLSGIETCASRRDDKIITAIQVSWRQGDFYSSHSPNKTFQLTILDSSYTAVSRTVMVLHWVSHSVQNTCWGRL